MKKNFYVILSILGIIGGIAIICFYSMIEISPASIKEFCYVSILVGSAALLGSILFYRRFVYLKLITIISIIFSIIIICCSLYFIFNGEDLTDYSKQYHSIMNDVNFEKDEVIRAELIEEALKYNNKSFIKSYNPLFTMTMFFGIYYSLFSIFCLFKIFNSKNALNDNKEIPTDNQETMINELKEKIKNLENK